MDQVQKSDYEQTKEMMVKASALLLEIGERSISKEYQCQYTDEGFIALAIGNVVSKVITSFDGEQGSLILLKALSNCLEDSNWHAENERIVVMIEKLESGAQLADVLPE
jgi:hypothetical protein